MKERREHSVSPFPRVARSRTAPRKASKLVKTFPAVLDRVEPRTASRPRTAGNVSQRGERFQAVLDRARHGFTDQA